MLYAKVWIFFDSSLSLSRNSLLKIVYTVQFKKGVDLSDEAALSASFESVEGSGVSCCNWPERFGYAPEVEFRMFHTGDCLAVRYDVRERCTAALVDADGGRVCTDSCVEFFFQPSGGDKYYNLEANCTGRILFARRSGREDAQRALPSSLKGILRFPSLGSVPFAERRGDIRWSLMLVIPAKAYFGGEFESFSGLNGRFNVYKCGDNLSMPHFLSYAPVGTPSPDFHRPEFFTGIAFG